MKKTHQNILLFGGTGTIGERILNEAVSRGHKVTLVVRNTQSSALVPNSNVSLEQGDLLKPATWAAKLTATDAVISAYGPGNEGDDKVVQATQSLLETLHQVPGTRLLSVGGAGSLDVAPGLQLVDAPSFPESYKSIALAHREALDLYRNDETDTPWTNVSPPLVIEPGERTGAYRQSKDSLIKDENGESRISCEDFAVAIIDELEKPQHVRERFTVAY